MKNDTREQRRQIPLRLVKNFRVTLRIAFATSPLHHAHGFSVRDFCGEALAKRQGAQCLQK